MTVPDNKATVSRKTSSSKVIQRAEMALALGLNTKERTRIQALRDDMWVTAFDKKRVLCAGCSTVLKLDRRNDYYAGLWTKHKGRCPGIRAVYESLGSEVPKEWTEVSIKYGKCKTRSPPISAPAHAPTRDMDAVLAALILVKDLHQPAVPEDHCQTYERQSASESPMSSSSSVASSLSSSSSQVSEDMPAEYRDMTSAEQFAIRWLAEGESMKAVQAQGAIEPW